MLDFSNWEVVGLAVDVVIVFFLNRYYRNKAKDAELVSQAPSFSVSDKLQSALDTSADGVLPYACVQGITEPLGTAIKSHYTDALGVVQHQLLVEHKSKRMQGFWADVKNVVKDQLNICPFAIVNPDREAGNGVRVDLSDVMKAEYLRDSLQITHDQFHPSSEGFLSRSFDRLFGDLTKGYQETEKMLAVGSPVLVIGKLMMEDERRIVLSAPDDQSMYILTTSSRPELIRSLRSEARVVRIVCWVLGLSGVAFLAYIVYRNVSRARDAARTRSALDKYRLERLAATRSNGDAPDESQPACVVCLSQPRDVLILECGHICVCSDCALALPSPKSCPVCRQAVDRIVPIYLP